MRWAIILVMAGGCYSPSIPTGAPCDKERPCPRPLVCATGTNTCERSELDAWVPGTDQPIDAYVAPIDSPPLAGCTPTGFDVCGDGLDQDCDGADEVCAANDLAAGAIDVTMGGKQTGDLNLARDNAPQRGCGNDGGRDLYYKVTLAAPEVYYFDTFGSNFDVTVRVFPGKACSAINAADMPACSDDACATPNAQLAVALPAGTSCVVVDQNAAATAGALSLTIVPGGHTGAALASGAHTVTGDTCTETDVFDSTCMGAGGKDIAWFFTVCPAATAHVDASTCTDATNVHFDTVLYLRRTVGQSRTIECNDDAAGCAMIRPDRADMHPDLSTLDNVAVAGPGLFWLVLDGYETPACGGYQLDYNLH